MKLVKKRLLFGGKSYLAKAGFVYWKDACSASQCEGQVYKKPVCLTLGFVFEFEGDYIVVYNFTDGVIDDYMRIPKDWNTKVFYWRV